MSLRELFIVLKNNKSEKVLTKKLACLELEVTQLKETLQTIRDQADKEKSPQPKEPPIIIEKITIEKIILDKYELNNNFGQLGIKELKGKLNIGATYGSEFTPNLDAENKKTKVSREKVNTPGQTEFRSPKVNIKAKRETN